MRRQRFRWIFRRNRVEQELDAELRFHLEKQVELHVARGMAAGEARAAALRAFGGVEQVKEECRDARAAAFLDTLLQDVRYGLRMMRRSPAFTSVAALSLALGIGANTAIFSLIDAVMLRMLPVKNPAQLVVLTWKAKQWPNISHSGNTWGSPRGPVSGSSISYPAFQQLRKRNDVLSDLLAFAEVGRANVSSGGRAEMAGGQLVSGNYFSALGVEPILGRTFVASDDRPAADPVAVISFRFWNRRFGMDPSAVGKAIVVNGAPLTIIGVTPPEFFGVSPGEYPDLWIPVSLQPRMHLGWSQGELLAAADYWWLMPMGRPKPGVSADQARATLDVIFRQTQEAPQMASIALSPGSKGLDGLRSEFSQPLFVLMSVVGLVLLIACANVANLLLARATARQKETAVRLALGAGRLRLVRQSLTESVLLSALGGMLGLLLALRGSELLAALMLPEFLYLSLRPDLPVFLFCAVVSVFTGIAFGIAPALRATRVDVSPALKATTGSRGTGRLRFGFGKALVASQVAMSLLLLIGASLFVRSLQKLNAIDLGFNRESLLLFGVNGKLNGYERERLGNLYRQIQERIEDLPGVRSVSLSGHRLIGDGSSRSSFSIAGQKTRPDEERAAHWNGVGPRFFETMGIPILLGRGLTNRDNEAAPKVVVVDEAFARRYFANESAVGKRLSWHDQDVEIVGVARDAKYSDVRRATDATIYQPYLQVLQLLQGMNFEVRTAGDATSLIPGVRRAVAAVDANLPLMDIRTQAQQIEGSLLQERLFARLTSGFGFLALLLASIGLYGVMAYMVARRTGEIGIRMAMGAGQGDVMQMVLRETVLVTGIGMLVGLAGAMASTRLIRNQLFGLTPTDPVSMAVAVAVLAAVAAAAGYIPARRASRIDPMTALRNE